MAKPQRMSEKEFDEKKHKLCKLSTQNNELARLILVEGLTNTEAAERLQIVRQNVSGTMNRIMALLNDMPADYVLLQEWMPRSTAATIRKYLRDEEEKSAAAKNKTNKSK